MNKSRTGLTAGGIVDCHFTQIRGKNSVKSAWLATCMMANICSIRALSSSMHAVQTQLGVQQRIHLSARECCSCVARLQCSSCT